ncbi:MAG: ABC transporter ATP-binding protein [Clostridium sp.]|nr:ABC transporter ATP-binding protein [Clostridium sp.]
MIKADSLTKIYYSSNNSFTALKEISFSIKKGEFLAIVGRSGSGKSTLLNILGTLDKPTFGSVTVNNKRLDCLTKKQLDQYRNKEIGFVFQSFHLEPSYSVYKNVEIPLLIANIPAKERKEKILNALFKVDMLGKEKNYAAQLSGGEKQRVCIARALVNSPSIILADEPCGNLDSVNGKVVMELLKKLAQEGKTVVLVTHNMEDAKMADRIITLKDGQVISDKTL